MRELALFAGAGGGILGGHLLGWTTVCAVEIEDYPRRVLLARQRDGALPRFPIWDDITTFDGRPWRGRVDVISGGFPCQDISAAGKGAGIEGSRSGLWREMARIIGEVRPRFVFVENSPMLVRRGLAVVLGDLAALGFDARWCVLGAHHAGAPHKRDRIWILATNAERAGLEGQRAKPGGAKKPQSGNGDSLANADPERLQGRGVPGERRPQKSDSAGGGRGDETLANSGQHGRVAWWASDPAEEPGRWELDRSGECADVADANGINRGAGTGGEDGPEVGHRGDVPDAEERDGHDVRGERPQKDATGDSPGERPGSTQPQLGRVAHGVAHRVDRLKAIGNGQVPAVAALAWRALGGPCA